MLLLPVLQSLRKYAKGRGNASSLHPPDLALENADQLLTLQVSSIFLVVKTSKIVVLIYTVPQKEDIILLYIGYQSIPK